MKIYSHDCVPENLVSSEMGRVLTEIDKIDPNFSQVRFVEQLKHDIIPNIMGVSYIGNAVFFFKHKRYL